MNVRRLLLYLVLNAMVSGLVAWGVLWLWNETHPVSPLLITTTAAAATSTAAPPGPQPTNAPPPTEFAAPTQTVYVVKAGDTLGTIAQHFDVSVEELMAANGLTDRNLVSVGQSLIVPVAGSVPPTAAPATPALLPTNAVEPPRATATRDPNQPAPIVTIREVSGVGQLADEAVLVVNDGGPVDLEGWTLRDETGHLYTFPTLMLFAGGSVNLHTATGVDAAGDLYWGQASAVWARGKSALLSDAAGSLQARYQIP